MSTNDDLPDRVRAALETRRGEWPMVVKTCEVSHSWISQFVRGKIPNPGHYTLKRIEARLCQRADTEAADWSDPKLIERRAIPDRRDADAAAGQQPGVV